MKTTAILLIFVFGTHVLFGQDAQKYQDSLFNVIKTSTEYSEKASAHNRLSWLFINNDITAAKAHLDSSFVLYTSIKDKKGIALCNYKYGVLYRVSGDYKASLDYLNKYQTFVELKQNTAGIANILYQKGVVYSLQGDYENSLKEYYKTLTIYETLKDSTSMGFTLNSIGIVYKNLKRYNQAIENYQKAVIIHKKSNDIENLANVYNSLGSVYAEQKDHDKALEFFTKTLEIDVETKNNWGIAINHKDIGTLLIEKEQYNKAITHFNNAYKIQEANNFDAEKAETLTKISLAYMMLGNYNKSELFLKKSFQEKISSKKIYKDLHFQSYKLYNKKGNLKQALSHHENYTLYKDSILNEDNLKNINALKIQFETQKKDNEIIQQQLLLEHNENELQKKEIQYSYMTGIAIFLLVSSILTWLVFKQRQKRKNQELIVLKNEAQINSLESLIEGEEKERLRIAKELHDGVNGDLSAIKHKLNTLLKLNNKTIEEAVVMIDKSCEQVRAISHNLVPPALENFDLQTAASDYCTSMNNIHKPKIAFSYLGDTIDLPKIIEINIFRIIQELVTNSIKHAEAKTINVQLSVQGETIQLAVEDDGKGFDVSKPKTNGVGISNIKHRVSFLNGEIDFTSNSEGTFVNILMDKTQFNVS